MSAQLKYDSTEMLNPTHGRTNSHARTHKYTYTHSWYAYCLRTRYCRINFTKTFFLN